MTDIHIQAEGISVQFDLVGVDHYDSSSPCWRVGLKLSHPTGNFSYVANDIWIDTEVWDSFVLELAAGVRGRAIFHDLSGYFVLELERKERYFEISVNVREPLVNKGDLNLIAKYTVDLDSGFIEKLRDGFAEHPKFG
ncbi:hypothetical protein FACS1894205_6560 [Alphaproteobacteria bacterium]|nr:hypothetical protein FACS1894205_6560 [Alphaproteobacteria bacterium]